jgi:hypothetical protein
MLTDAKPSSMGGGQNIEETKETLILMKEGKSAMNSRKHRKHGVDVVMK